MDERMMICSPIADMALPGSQRRHCAKCGGEVWLARGGQAWEKEARLRGTATNYVCKHCAFKIAAPGETGYAPAGIVAEIAEELNIPPESVEKIVKENSIRDLLSPPFW